MSALACEPNSSNAATAQVKILIVVSPSNQKSYIAGPNTACHTVEDRLITLGLGNDEAIAKQP
jgi:hypothetical protein